MKRDSERRVFGRVSGTTFTLTNDEQGRSGTGQRSPGFEKDFFETCFRSPLTKIPQLNIKNTLLSRLFRRMQAGP